VDGALRALRRKECVAMLMDRDYSRRKEYTRFLGAPARLPMGVATIAVRTGAPVLQGYLFREPDDTFRFRICRPLYVSRRDSVREVHEALCDNLAAAVAEHPTQWFKFEPMWETQAWEVA
jgi:KDO2-lipid IV(A) lauroyltransferase